MVSISARTFQNGRQTSSIDGYFDIEFTDISRKNRQWVLTVDTVAGIYFSGKRVPAGGIHYFPNSSQRITDALVAAAIRDGLITPAKHGQPPETS